MSIEIDMSGVTTVLVPSGREYARCAEALETELGLTVPKFTGRQYGIRSNKRTYCQVKGKDVPAYLARGYGDLGITGSDVCRESIPSDPLDSNLVYEEVGEPMCGFYLLFPKDRAAGLQARLDDSESVRVLVASSFPNFLADCLAKATPNLSDRVALSSFRPSGSTEGVVSLDVSDAVADLVETGTTLDANNLVRGPKLADVRPAIVWRDPAKKNWPLQTPTAVDRQLTLRVGQMDDPTVDSYTLQRLRDPNLAIKKLGEEGAEFLATVSSGAGRLACTEELADMVYAALVAAQAHGQRVTLAGLVSILDLRAEVSSLQRR